MDMPKSIGPYTIKRVIASGGMGIVYEARQEKPSRSVALKVMQISITSKSALRRFEYESQLLARLSHPGIAQVFGAGTYDDGTTTVPYFAMEYVPDARSIIAYAAEKNLGTRERLEIFAQVCDAIHHGHQKGIIHRDLKPGNILVNPEGQVKIIDFGVALSTDSDVTLTTSKTDVGQLIGTLQYMSPEQCAADPNDIDTRSDVYALGVVLYELLCGRLPYDVKQKAFHEVTRVIREEPPTKPSTISKQLRGDVETIALKALEKERIRRYQTAVELAQDIGRYLSGEAIIGRPPSFVYQLRTFSRKHRVLAAALTSVFIVLAIGVTASTGMYLQAEGARAETAKERDRALVAEQEAEKRRAETEVVTTFLSDTLAAVDPSIALGRELTIREMLDDASGQMGDSFADQPLVEATLHTTIGNTYRALGDYPNSEPHLQSALELRQRELGPEHADLRDAMTNRALLHIDLGQYDEAEPLLESALNFSQTALGDHHAETLSTMNNLAFLYVLQGRQESAEEMYTALLHAGQSSLGEDHPTTLAAMNDLAVLLAHHDRNEEALALFNKVFENTRQILESEEPDYLILMNNLGFPYQDRQTLIEAEALYKRIIELHRNVAGDLHPDTLRATANLASFYYGRGQFDLAEPLYTQVLNSHRRVSGDHHPSTLQAMDNLAGLFRRQGRYDDAEELYRQTLELLRKHLGEHHPQTLDTMNGLAGMYRDQARYDQAEQLRRHVLESRKTALGAEHPSTQMSMLFLAFVHVDQDHFTEAEQLYKSTIELRSAALGNEHPHTLIPMMLLAKMYAKQGALEKAEPLFISVIDSARRGLPAGDWHLGAYLFNYGKCMQSAGQHEKAEALFIEAHRVFTDARIMKSRRVLQVVEALVSLYDSWGKDSEAARWRKKLL